MQLVYEILSVRNELLIGKIGKVVNTNTSWLTERFIKLEAAVKRIML